MDPNSSYRAYLDAVEDDKCIEDFKNDRKFAAFVLAYKCQSSNNHFFSNWTVGSLDKDAMDTALKNEISKQPITVRIDMLRIGRNLKTFLRTFDHFVTTVTYWNLGEAANGIIISVFVDRIPPEYKAYCPLTLEISEWRNFAKFIDGKVHAPTPSASTTPAPSAPSTPTPTPIASSTPHTSSCSTASIQSRTSTTYSELSSNRPALIFESPPTPGKPFISDKISITTVSGFKEAEELPHRNTYAIDIYKNDEINIFTILKCVEQKIELFEIKTRKKKKEEFYCDLIEIFTSKISNDCQPNVLLKNIDLLNLFKKLCLPDDSIDVSKSFKKLKTSKDNIKNVLKIKIYFMPSEITCKPMIICSEAVKKFALEAPKRKQGETIQLLNSDVLSSI